MPVSFPLRTTTRSLAFFALMTQFACTSMSGAPISSGGGNHAAPVDATPASFAAGDSWGTNANVVLGGRALDEDHWEPVEDHFALGLEFDLRPADLPIGIEFGLAGSVGDDDVRVGGFDVDLEASVGELYIGPRLTFGAPVGEPGLRPYLGAGVTLLRAELEAIAGGNVVSDDDGAVAGYAHLGAYYQTASGLNLGVDLRTVFGADVTLFGVEADADYVQLGFVIGGGF